MKLAAFVFALSLVACASLAPRPAPPQVVLDSISAFAIGPADAQARIRLSVQNPNGYDLAVESLEYTLTIDGRPLGGGALAHPVTLAASATTLVDLDVAADLDVLGKSLDRAVRRGALPYELEGRVVLANGMRLPFHRHGEFNPLRNLLH